MKRIRPLFNSEYENLNWEKVFKDFDLIRIRTESDGSCFFHAICKAYFKPYILGKVLAKEEESTESRSFDRKKFVRNLRTDLSKMLGAKISPEDKNSKTYYETLAGGELASIAQEMPEYSLSKMQKELDSSAPISNIYNEFISDQLNIDIYILDGIKRDVYMTGTEDELLYKNRNSVVILYLPGHYELIGLMKNSSKIETYFSPTSPLIQRIRERMNRLRKV